MIILPSVILTMSVGDDRDYMEWLYQRASPFDVLYCVEDIYR